MKSTKPTSKEFKQLIGTFRKDRDAPKIQSAPINVLPLPPEGYSDLQKQLWVDICEYLQAHGTLQSIGTLLIGVYCDMYKIYYDSQIQIQNDGLFIKVNTRSGHVMRKHPCLDIIKDALNHMTAIADRFGFTPLAQGKISKSFEAPTNEVIDDEFNI